MLRSALRKTTLALLLVVSISIANALTHKVRRGETLSEIARAYGVSTTSLKTANNLKDANQIRIGQSLSIPAGGHAVGAYTVRKGDSLSTIAAQHGISTRKLASMNGIRNANHIKVGQKLKVPVEGSSGLKQLSKKDKRALDSINIRRSKWKHIILHHTATANGTPSGFDKMHRKRGMENGLAYHFLIGNGNGMADGELYICDRWKQQIQGGHMASAKLNDMAIGICLVGNFEKTRPTTKQLAQLEGLIEYLIGQTRVPSNRITTHTLAHRNHTLCPGKYFPFEQIKRKF